jgi:20S proteasome alpha/beta subunit
MVRLNNHPILELFLLLSIFFRVTLGSQAAGTETLVGIVGKDFVLLGADSSVSQSISLTASNLDKIAALSEPFFYDDARSSRTQQQQTIVAAAAGDAADSDRLVGMLQAHATIQEYQSGLGCDVDYNSYPNDVPTEAGLDVEAMAYLARGQIASALRSKTPLKVCLLIAGMMATNDNDNGENTSTHSFVAERVQKQVQQSWVSAAASTTRKATTVETPDTTSTHIDISSSLQPRLYWLDEYGSIQKIQYGAQGLGSNFCLSILDQGYHPQMTREEATKLLRDCFQQLRTRYVINSPQPHCIKCVDANGVRLIR